MGTKILHYNISIGNIILKIAEDDSFLINLNLAIRLDWQIASRVLSKTNTKVFIAIGTLYSDKDHSFIYNLKSFF